MKKDSSNVKIEDVNQSKLDKLISQHLMFGDLLVKMSEEILRLI